jgi:phosphoglycolate phosphatase
LAGWRQLALVAYRELEHVAERLVVHGSRRLGEPSVEWARRIREDLAGLVVERAVLGVPGIRADRTSAPRDLCAAASQACQTIRSTSRSTSSSSLCRRRSRGDLRVQPVTSVASAHARKHAAPSGTLVSDSHSGELGYADAVQRIVRSSRIDPPEDTSGGTDYGILERLFIRSGMASAQAQLLIPAALYELERITTDQSVIAQDRVLLDGINDAISVLEEIGALQSLVTGNSRHRAAAKLAAFGLEQRLDMRCGGFGDHTSERWRLVEEARARAGLLHAGREDAIPLRRTFVIGDTAHDVEAARQAGVGSIAVATGSYTAEELSRATPDLLLPDLAKGLGQLTALIEDCVAS